MTIQKIRRFAPLVSLITVILFMPAINLALLQAQLGIPTVHAALRAEPQSGSTCGTGIAHCVILTWGPPPSGTAPATYNVKRSTASGAETTIGTTTAPTATYTDTAGVGGTTYFYVVTAVNPQASPTESGPSNEVSATFLPLAQPGAPGSLVATRN